MIRIRTGQQHRRRERSGFSLLEIVLALAIFGLAMAALGGIVSVGARAATEARDLTRAQLLCESKLSEVILSEVTPVPTQATPMISSDTLRTWYSTVEVQPAPIEGLLVVRVTVATEPNDVSIRPVSYSLSRLMIDPILGLHLPPEAEEDMSSSTGGL